MSLFEDKRYRWRETYFVLFDVKKRPKLESVSKALKKSGSRLELTNPFADDDGLFESITLFSPDDFAAMDISYTEGDEVTEQTPELVEELKKFADDETEIPYDKILKAEARLDVLHFERVDADPQNEDDEDDMLDPGSLLAVLEALAKLTKGVAIDPQSGTIIEEQ